MSKFSDRNFRLFYYLGLIQLITALCAGIISLLFVRYAEGSVYDLILGFLPDVSLNTWSTIGLMMLAVQVFGNLTGVVFSFLRLDPAGRIAIIIGGSEMLWMIFQYFILHTHNILIFLFFGLAVAQFVIGFLLNERVKELKEMV
jgi:hypothetical protein